MGQIIYKVNPLTYDFKIFKRYREIDGIYFYYHKFPLTKYRSKTTSVTTLECELCINSETGEVSVDVYDINHNIYTPFYANRFGGYDYILEKIEDEIFKETTRLGIEVITT